MTPAFRFYKPPFGYPREMEQYKPPPGRPLLCEAYEFLQALKQRPDRVARRAEKELSKRLTQQSLEEPPMETLADCMPPVWAVED